MLYSVEMVTCSCKRPRCGTFGARSRFGCYFDGKSVEEKLSRRRGGCRPARPPNTAASSSRTSVRVSVVVRSDNSERCRH
eukprot:IDg8681t1